MSAPNLDFEKRLWKQGLQYIAGVDEVGRGCWAGPVVAAAVILPQDFKIPAEFNESKQVKPPLRKIFAQYIKDVAISYFICEVSVTIINKIGIGKATQVAFRQAVNKLKIKANFVLIDAFYINHFSRKNQEAIVKGDEKCASIAAASIIAKVHRDSLMEKLANHYPQYGFEKHKGYGTEVHQAAIKNLGFTKIHRTNYNLNFLFA